MFYSTNPYTEQRIMEYDYDTTQSLKIKLNLSNDAFHEWSALNIAERALQIKNIGRCLEKYSKIAAETITKEMGKPITQSEQEIKKCIALCEYYANEGIKLLTTKNKEIPLFKDSYVLYEPLGVILGIMPWNFPFWQVIRFVIPTLLAGNSVVIKHALNVPECALLISKIINEALNVDNAYVNIFTKNRVTESIIGDAIIRGVSLTGGTKAGKIVAKIAGKTLKPVVLELGGSNALIVFEDADVEKAATACVKARFQNNGQSCIAGKRLLVHEKVQSKFMQCLLEKVTNLKVGDPMNPETEISVLAKREFVMTLEQQLDLSVDNGAMILVGGSNESYAFEPTVISNVTPEMPLFNQETFGPVLAVTTFKTDEEAITLSNSTEYGLGVSLFSENIDRIKTLIPKFKEGAVFINTFVQSVPQLPFGGTKSSGLGRELGEEGLKAFVNVKTVVIQ